MLDTIFLAGGLLGTKTKKNSEKVSETPEYNRKHTSSYSDTQSVKFAVIYQAKLSRECRPGYGRFTLKDRWENGLEDNAKPPVESLDQSQADVSNSIRIEAARNKCFSAARTRRCSTGSQEVADAVACTEGDTGAYPVVVVDYNGSVLS